MRVALCCCVAALAFAAEPQKPDKPISAIPQVVERGQTVSITLASATPGAAKIWLGEYRLKDATLAGTAPIVIRIPETLEETLIQSPPATENEKARPKRPVEGPFPLGAYPIRVELAGQTLVTPDPINVIALHGAVLKITEVTPRFVYLEEKPLSFTIHGTGFATRHESDNVLLLNRDEREVVWDGCDASLWQPGEKSKIHGRVRSPRQIEICNVDMARASKLAVGLRQGTAEERAPQPIRSADWSRGGISWLSIGVVVCMALIVYALLAIKRGYKWGDAARALFLDLETNTYSLSKLQFYLWTAAALFSYSYFALSKLLVQLAGDLPPVPGTLPGIVAIGAGTAVGSQLVSGMRGPKGGGDENPSLSDLITSGGVVAADRVQLLAWTLLTVVGYSIAVLRQDPGTMEALPVIPENLLFLSGLSSMGYLGAKFARKPGPVINEISIEPPSSEKTLQPEQAPAAAAGIDLARPVAAAKDTMAKVKTAAASLAGSASPAAKQALGAVAALDTGISEAAVLTAGTATGGLTKLGSLSTAAREAAAAAATEFDKLAGVTSPDAETARQSAAISQLAAWAVEELSNRASEAINAGQLETAALKKRQTGFRRVIEIRGRNLSAEATFTLSAKGREDELPLRMTDEIEDKRGNLIRAPRIVVPEEETGTPNMGRRLKLSIPRDELEPADRMVYDRWFGQDEPKLIFTITNPDGQKADIRFSIPPGSSQDK